MGRGTDRRRSYDGKTVIVTGAARGLGRALAERFGRAGARIGGVDVLGDELTAARDELRATGVRLECAVADLADEAATAAAFRELRTRLGPIDVLVNNAGITRVQPFDAGGSAVVRRVMEVNFQGAVHATAAAFDDLVARRGQIVVISSVAGFAPLWGRTGYSASKHALHGFFDTLRAELHGTGVEVLMVCPSFIATGIRGRSVAGGRIPGVEDRPQAVAERIFAAAERRRRFLTTGRLGWLSFWVHRFAPRLYEALMRRSIGG